MPHQPVIDGFEFASAGAPPRGTWPLKDELILALPVAPRHEDCTAAGLHDGDAGESPFAALRGLIRSKH